MGDNVKSGLSEDHLNYNSANLSSDWRLGSANFTNSQMGSIHIGDNPLVLCKEDLVVGPSSSRSTAPIGDSYCLPPWELQNNSHDLDFSDISFKNSTTTSKTMEFGKFVPGAIGNGTDNRLDITWNQQSSMLQDGLFLSNVPSSPQSFSQFPCDSGFIERAAKFSCFSNGNFSDMVNPFGVAVLTGIEKDVSLSVRNGDAPVSLVANERSESMSRSRDELKQRANVSGNESDDANLSGGGGQKGLGSRKRKMIIQDTELDQVKGDPLHSCEPATDSIELQQKGNHNASLTASKNKGKQSKNGPQATEDPIKDDYIHVRARRGQATNSHSLAERVRREKISERMKFLQDLVPGCNKVTGKAVMLDEIINYVQSLQRQVELPNAWEDELHNVVQMGFSPTTPTGSQDLTGAK